MKKYIFLFGLFISSFGSGFEHTFLNTLMPAITYDLGGMEFFTWASISFTLGSLLFMPLLGILAERYNKMYLFMGGIGLNILGAILCALSENMLQLIAFRFIQGIGAGVITFMTSIAIVLVFQIKDRVKWNAVLGIVYTTSTLMGPITAAAIAEYFSWRLIFLSPILFFAVSSVLLIIGGKNIMAPSTTQAHTPIRFTNNLVLIILVTFIALFLSFGGVYISLTSIWFYVIIALIVLFSYIFFKMETRKNEMGMFHYQHFKNKLFVQSLAISMGVSMGKLIVLTFVPMFIMVSMQTSIDKAGYVLIPMLIMAPVSTYISGKLLLHVAYKPIIFLNVLSVTVGLFIFAHIGPTTPYLFALIASGILGLGAGTVSQLLLIILQEHFPKAEMISITSMFTFFRWIGNLIGISIGTFLLMFFSGLAFKGDIVTNISLNDLYQQVFNNKTNVELIENWSFVFQHLFLVTAFILLFTTILSLFLGNGRVNTEKNKV